MKGLFWSLWWRLRDGGCRYFVRVRVEMWSLLPRVFGGMLSKLLVIGFEVVVWIQGMGLAI